MPSSLRCDHTLLKSERVQPWETLHDCWSSGSSDAANFLSSWKWLQVFFLPPSLLSLRLPLTWQVFGSATLRLMVPSCGSMQISSTTTTTTTPSRSHCVELIVIFLLLFLSRPSQGLTVTQLELLSLSSLSLTNLLPPFLFSVFKMTQVGLFVSRACCLGTEGRAGSCGGMIFAMN